MGLKENLILGDFGKNIKKKLIKNISLGWRIHYPDFCIQ